MIDSSFFYDLGSPYAWLAAQRVDTLVDPAPEWVPVLLGGIFRATGRSSWGRTERRGQGMAEVERRARARGLAAPRWPEQWPNDGLVAMRVATHAHRVGRGREFALAAFDVHFAEGRRLDDPDNVVVAAQRAGLGEDALLAAARDDVKAELRAQTERALALGVVGVPALVLGDRILWGDDALDGV